MYISILAFVIGLFAIWGTIAKPNFFWESRKAQRARSFLGDRGTQILYIGLGLVLIIVGIVTGYLNFYESKADRLYDEGRFEEGLATYLELHDFSNDDVTYLNGVAYGYYRLENYEEAEKYAEMSRAEEESNNFDPFVILAWIHENKGEYEKAIEVLEELKQQDAEYVYGLQLLGDNYYQSDQYEKAIENYKLAIELEPETGNTYVNLANSYYQLAEYEKELAVYEQMRSNNAVINNQTLEETNKLIDYNCGDTYYCLGEYEKASENFQRVVAYDSEDYDAWYYLASCQALLEQYDEAKISLAKAFELNSAYAEQIHSDADFAGLMGDDEFQNLIKHYTD